MDFFCMQNQLFSIIMQKKMCAIHKQAKFVCKNLGQFIYSHSSLGLVQLGVCYQSFDSGYR